MSRVALLALLTSVPPLLAGASPVRPGPGRHGGGRVDRDLKRPGERRRRSRGRPREPDLAGVLTEVAARLRAGAPVERAWQETVRRRQVADFPRWREVTERSGLSVAVALAERVGAPLADVLDRCAGGLAEAEAAETARRVALAGPAATARLLGWLPLVGLLLGWGLGADPFRTVLDGGPGTACALAGVGLVVAGRRWIGSLVRAAHGPGVERG